MPFAKKRFDSNLEAVHHEKKIQKKIARSTWRRTVEIFLKEMQHSWGTLTSLAQDKQGWRSFVVALHTTGCTER